MNQLDVELAFVNEILEEEDCIEQPSGYQKKEEKDKVCRLRKTYGLKQAQWIGTVGLMVSA